MLCNLHPIVPTVPSSTLRGNVRVVDTPVAEAWCGGSLMCGKRRALHREQPGQQSVRSVASWPLCSLHAQAY